MADQTYSIKLEGKSESLIKSLSAADKATKNFAQAERNLQKIHIDSARSTDLIKGARTEAMYALLKLRKEVQNGVISEKQYKTAVEQVKTALANKTQGINTMNKAMFAGRQVSRQMRAGFGQLGHQIQDVAVQLQMGQNGFLVFAQQGSQIASLFGPGGALVGAIMAVGGAIAMTLIPSLKDTKVELADVGEEIKSVAGDFDLLSTKLQIASRAAQVFKIKDMKEELGRLKEELADFKDLGIFDVLMRNLNPEGYLEEGTKIITNIALQNEKVKEAQENMDIMSGKYSMTSKQAKEWIKSLGEETDAIGKTEHEKMLAVVDKMPPALQAEARALIQKNRILKAQEEAYKNALKAGKELAKEQADEAIKIKKQAEKEMLAAAIYALNKMNKEEAEAHKARLASALYMLDQMNKAEEEAAKKREKIQQAYTKSALEAAKNVNEAYKSIRESGIKKVEDGMVDLIMGTKSVSESFKSMARSIIADLARLQIQRTITAPLSQALQSFTSGYLGTSTINTPDGATLYNPNLDTRATGGPVAKNTPYMVGERGPELFIPSGAGSITKNSDLVGEGVTVVQNINVTTGVQQTVRTEIMGMMPQIATAAKGAVLDARRRGGSFAGAFG